MKVIKILPYGFGCNSYIVTKDGKNAVVIDCSGPEVYDECIDRALTPVAVLLTHGHFDHVGGCGKFFERGVPVYCSEAEAPLIFNEHGKGIFSEMYIPQFEIYKTLKDGEEFELGGIKFKAILTPGHTAGGTCYLAEDNLFTGDTLFRENIGRSDLPTGNGRKLIESLNKLFSLDGDYKVYCGHGQETTLDYERKHNPFIK